MKIKMNDVCRDYARTLFLEGEYDDDFVVRILSGEFDMAVVERMTVLVKATMLSLFNEKTLTR